MRKTIILLILSLAMSMLILESSYGAAGDVGSTCASITANTFSACSGTTTMCVPQTASTFTTQANTICRCAANHYLKAAADIVCAPCGPGGTKATSGTFADADITTATCTCASGTFAAATGCVCAALQAQNSTTGACTPVALATCPLTGACTCVSNASATSNVCACNSGFIASSSACVSAVASSTTSTTSTTTEGDDEGDEEDASFAMQPIIAALLVAAVALFA